MARAGLGSSWTCLFANDIDEKKAASYKENWGDEALKTGDVGALSTADLPGKADLTWASFPCQDLSLAGNGAGLKGSRSGNFWPFWRLTKALREEGRQPGFIVLENVCGALTSHRGRDFAALATALTDADYRIGALVIDAVHFVPQSRPRLFIIAIDKGISVAPHLLGQAPDVRWTPPALLHAYEKLSDAQQRRWLWWNLPAPKNRVARLCEFIEDDPQGVRWHSEAETAGLLGLMSPLNRKKVEFARKRGKRVIGTIYKRTRPDETGRRTQRAEVRFDDIAGCLRTPVGGSSRQLLMLLEGQSTRSRLLSPREAARLMGLPESYLLPENHNDAYHLAGDGVVVPVVRHLAEHLIEPILESRATDQREAA